MSDAHPPTVIALDDADPQLAQIRLPSRSGGRSVQVAPIDGIVMQHIRTAERERDETGSLDTFYDKVLPRLLPDATPEEVRSISPWHIERVIELSYTPVARVQEILKNAAGPSQNESGATARRSRSRRSTR